MIEDMSVRGFTEDTRRDHIRHVKAFAAFTGRLPDTATPEDLRRFQLNQTQAGVQPPSINSAVIRRPGRSHLPRATHPSQPTPDLQIPIAVPSVPRAPSLEAFRRRLPCVTAPHAMGRHPKPFTTTVIQLMISQCL
jgi:hypothetical protein